MSTRRVRGLVALVRDAVHHGSRAVEQVQRDSARRTYAVLERIPLIAAPARGVHAIHEAALSTVHGSIRLINRAAGAVLTLGLDAATPPAGRADIAAGPAAEPAAERTKR